jgi:hypothetical protein
MENHIHAFPPDGSDRRPGLLVEKVDRGDYDDVIMPPFRAAQAALKAGGN